MQSASINTLEQANSAPAQDTSANKTGEVCLDILRAAVTRARTAQVQRLAQLRQWLYENFPGQQANVDATLRYWAGQLRKSET